MFLVSLGDARTRPAAGRRPYPPYARRSARGRLYLAGVTPTGPPNRRPRRLPQRQPRRAVVVVTAYLLSDAVVFVLSTLAAGKALATIYTLCWAALGLVLVAVVAPLPRPDQPAVADALPVLKRRPPS